MREVRQGTSRRPVGHSVRGRHRDGLSYCIRRVKCMVRMNAFYSTGGAFLYFGIAETIILIASVMILGAVVRAFLFRTAGEDTKHELRPIQRYRQQGWKLGKSPYGQRAIPKVGQRPKPHLRGDIARRRRAISSLYPERTPKSILKNVCDLAAGSSRCYAGAFALVVYRSNNGSGARSLSSWSPASARPCRALISRKCRSRSAREDNRANAFKEADRLLASMSAASTSTLENL